MFHSLGWFYQLLALDNTVQDTECTLVCQKESNISKKVSIQSFCHMLNTHQEMAYLSDGFSSIQKNAYTLHCFQALLMVSRRLPLRLRFSCVLY